MSVLIRQAKIVDPQSEFHNKVVDILIDQGQIISIEKTIKATADQIIEGNNIHVSAGFVDVFADYCEPGYEHKETIETGLKAAAAGGFTDVLLLPNTNPTTNTKSAIKFILQKANGNIVSIHPLGAISKDIEGKSLAEMMDMHANGAIAFTDGWKPIQDANLMLKALEYAKSFDGVLLQIPINASLASGGLMHEGELSTRLGMAGIPILAETLMIHRDIELLRYTRSKLHITGVSTAEGVEMIRKAKVEGLNVTCSVTPYHLALTDETLETYDSKYKVSPVLRSETDRKALIQGLRDGTIDCIASHHHPQDWDAKTKEFEYAADGMNVQEIAFNIVCKAVEGEVSIDRVVDAFVFQPRNIFGLSTQNIQKGNVANLTVFSTAANFIPEENKLQSLSKNNPFMGMQYASKILGIFNQNQVHLNY